MTRIALVAVACWLASIAQAAPNHVTVRSDEAGHQLLVDGEPTFVKGMNWGYVPIGENYGYVFWDESDAFIETVLRREMGLLRAAGVNSIRQYADIPPRWVTWIWENYGISTLVNPLVGRYGATVDGRFVPMTNYADPATRAALLEQTLADVERFKDTPGVLFWLLGNENNYGLHWSGFEIQALPGEDRDTTRARALYSLMGEIIDAIHAVDPHHPVAIANGEIQYLDLIAEECENLDILASNVYRGLTARDLYQEVEDTLGIPFVYSEFGADAYDAKAGREDHVTQARYVRSQWEDIYLNAGERGVGNAIGGYVFQWSDGWWKFKQEENLDIHDNNASWATDAYIEDFVEGRFNMNEEWFGITAKGPPDVNGHFEVFPRAAYYVLRDAWQLDPYAPETTPERVREHFTAIDPQSYDGAYRAALAGGEVARLSRAYVSNVRVELSSFATTHAEATGQGKERVAFDHLESFYVDTRAPPSDALRADLSINVLGNVPGNRIDTIFYESRGRDLTGGDRDGASVDLSALERVRVYRAAVTWEHDLFTLDAFYREGHYHWGYEGDFFGLYREANYGPNVDIYNADVPIGMAFAGKRALDGLRLAFGPELYWGANPAFIGLYRRTVGPLELSVAHQEDLASQAQVKTSFAVPEQVTRKSTVAMGFDVGPVEVDVGGIMAGTDRLGDAFTRVEEAGPGPSYAGSGYHVLDDEIALADTLGARGRVVAEQGRFHLHADGELKGLVADGGVDGTQVFTGWTMRPSQRGNQAAVTTGLAVDFGPFQVAPNFLWQKPLEGPLPSIPDRWNARASRFTPAVTPRNVLADPFAVLENRRTTGFELLLAYDTTPGTWMWAWDNEMREDAPLAASLDLTYRLQPTSRDSNFGFLADGTLFSFDAAPPAQDLWDAKLRAIVNLRGDLQLLLGAGAGTAQARGLDRRLVTRGGGDVRLRWRSMAWDNQVKLDDWGPYDFHRDYNLTFPLQLQSDLSGGLTAPKLGVTSTRIGVATKYRTLDEHSPETFAGDIPRDLDEDGYELELGTYLFVSL